MIASNNVELMHERVDVAGVARRLKHFRR